ncbi:hypothetical protein [Ensifer sp. Root423]|uniref:hypothetical protein n=1 Tax=Ensifer sp. Root423 TaxID=1736534 RepID=UPI000ACE06DD|nr:hypothetical protein [Ensifer sp. Root423]
MVDDWRDAGTVDADPYASLYGGNNDPRIRLLAVQMIVGSHRAKPASNGSSVLAFLP